MAKATDGKPATRPPREAGFTLIEVLVAAFVLATGVGAAISILDSATRANDTAQRHQTAIKIAQRELENIDNLDFSQLALTSTPASSGDPNNPLNRVNGSQFTTEGGTAETMVIGGQDAAVSPGPEAVSEGGATSQVYRFVTWVDAPSYEGCTQNCSSTQDYKRITVAVQTKSGISQGFGKYVLVSNLRIDPFLGPEGRVTQPPDPNPTQAHDNFYLYDTPAASCSTNTYQQPSGSHATHDTRGYCGSGAGDYPDLMGIQAPPNPYDPDLPPLYTYSTDLAGAYSGGLAIQRRNDCTLDNPPLDKYQVHAWETNAVSASPYELTGKTSFDFWTAAVGGATVNGKVCAWLYDRNMVGGLPVDALIGNSSYELANWPGASLNLSFTFAHPSYTLPAGHRLRFVLTVSSASEADIQFLYDHPASPSFVQVRTTTPVSQ